MSILDELRQKVEEKKRAEHQQNLREQQLEQIYQQRLLPRMQRLLDTLREMVEYLNFLEEPLVVANYSGRYPQLGVLRQKNYKINTDGRLGMASYHRLMQINLSYCCEGEGSFSYLISPKSAVDREYRDLFDRGMRFQQKNQGPERAQFIVERRIPAYLRLLVDYPASKLKMISINHEDFQVVQKSFAPEQLDDEFVDALLSYLMRRDKRLVCYEVSAAEKTAILEAIAAFYNREMDSQATLPDRSAKSDGRIITPIKNILTKFQR